MKAVRKEDFNTEKNVRGKENIREERNTKEVEQWRENTDNRSVVGDAVWTRTSETGVTRKAWKVPVTSTTRTGGATKNMQAHNALLICSGKKDNRSGKVKSESNMTQTKKEKKMSKDDKKTESTRTFIQKVKAMKTETPKVKKSTETINSSNGEKLAHVKEMILKEPKTEKSNKMEESPKIEAARSENEDNKNNADKKLWNAILRGLKKKTRNLKLLLDKVWRVISIVGQNTEIFLNNINSYNVSFGI